jgi:hypothetical protein
LPSSSIKKRLAPDSSKSKALSKPSNRRPRFLLPEGKIQPRKRKGPRNLGCPDGPPARAPAPDGSDLTVQYPAADQLSLLAEERRCRRQHVFRSLSLVKKEEPDAL